MSKPNTDTTLSEESTDVKTSPTTDFEIRTNLYRGALALFVLLAVVAVVQLYASVGATIDRFIAHEYRPLFRAAFNLAVLLVAGIGISRCVRGLTGE